MANLQEYLSNVNRKFDKTKSVSGILKSFEVDTTELGVINGASYSNDNFILCNNDEKLDFYNKQLQFIECLVINQITGKVGNPVNWGEIYKLLIDPNYAQTLKNNRKVVYPTSFPKRPIGDAAFEMWNGLQIIDLDIKDAEIASKLKDELFNALSKYHWFLGICKSASQKGLHIWTKITPITVTHEQRKLEFICNFRHKYSFVYLILDALSSKIGYDSTKIIDYLDMAMAKPQQGIFISSDNLAYMNMNFQDHRLDVKFEQAFDNGIEAIDWVSHQKLRDIFAKLEWFAKEETVKSTVAIEQVQINEETRDASKNVRKHYKHAQRWQLANTLASLFGQDNGLKYLIEICSGTPKHELVGDINTAVTHDKPVSIWAIKELNKEHGFNIKVDGNDMFEKQMEQIKQENLLNKDIVDTLNKQSDKVELHIKSNQFLSDIQTDIINNLSHITLLEAGAGYGKTEMVKALKAKTMLILPFTSTIKSKVEADAATNDWLYFYGSKRPTIDDLMSNHNITMTIDKFANLNIMEIDNAGYEYIVLDESHLLFISQYRDVMAPAIQRLANCKAKIILMTGTPTGELLFFPGIRHIKVWKEDTRIKEFKICKTASKATFILTIADCMADDIIAGRKILYPTNQGQLYYKQLCGALMNRLTLKGCSRPIKTFYYKKSNYGTKDMDDINFLKTIGDNDVVFCTTYLSVGVDICDKKNFSVYFDEMMMRQDVEQFANRIRNNDLYIKLFLPLLDKDNVPLVYDRVEHLDLGFDEAELVLARDFVSMCNDMMVRNETEYRYNPIIQSMLTANKYLKYDENTCRYYIDETSYKLSTFEDRYKKYAKQLPILCQGMQDYGYQIIEQSEKPKEYTENEVADFDALLKNCKSAHYDEWTTNTMDYLNHITDDNIDVYKEMISGNYDLFRSDDKKMYREMNGIWEGDIEILEKNTPLILTLYKFFDIPTIKQIFQSCIDQKLNKLNYSKLKRITKLVTIDYNRKQQKIDLPVMKFIYDAKKWAEKNPRVKKEQIIKYIADYAVKYANSIPNLIVEDTLLLDKVFEMVKELWGVIIEQEKGRNRMVNIKPCELPWERKKTDIEKFGETATSEFFIGNLIDNVDTHKESEQERQVIEEYESTIPELEHANMMSIVQIKEKINEIVHKDFNYYVYSKEDMSNDRFLEKQQKQFVTRRPISDNESVEDAVVTITEQPDMFEMLDGECPF